MVKENFFTGAAEQPAAPVSSEFTTEQEAVYNAGFGKYDYDPTARMTQPVSIYPGGYGYGYNPQQPMYYGNPYLYYQQQQYAQQQAAYQQQMQQTIQTYIEPVNFSGEYLPTPDWQEMIDQLQMEYWMKEQKEAGEQAAKSNNMYNPFYSGVNYYGVPYINPFQYNYQMNAEISGRIQEIQNQAKENRTNLNMHMSRLVHNYIRDGCSEDEIFQRYHGKIVENPAGMQMTYGEFIEQQRFYGLVPFDNSEFYRQCNATVSKEFHDIIPEDSNMQETFKNMGIVYANYQMEEELHRRRDQSVLYNSQDNSYKNFVRAKAAERYAQSTGKGSLTKTISALDQQNTMAGAFPTLAQTAKLCEDGSLSITCPFGSKQGQVYTVENSQEAHYEENRERFQRFLDAIPDSIYLDSPNGND